MSTKIEQQRVVIAGSGPIGLYTAILLKKQYPDLDVIVLDGRMHEYQRPGIIAKQAVVEINSGLRHMRIPPIDVPDSGGYPTNNVYIRDLQHALMGHAKGIGVTLVADSFAGLKGNVITTKGQQAIPCSMLIDCTGEGRSVAKFMNKQSGNPLFDIQPIADNPIKNHFIAYVDMDKANCAKLDAHNSNPVAYAQAMQELRALGWQQFAEPEFTPTRWDTEDGARFCFYFEIPQAVAEAGIEVQHRYLQALLFLRSGQRIDFTRVESNLSFIPFDVDPKIVTEKFNMQPIPIALCGDALMSPEYRLGTGVSNGVGCADALVSSINVGPFAIDFNQKKYTFLRNQVVTQHQGRVTGEYQHKRNKLAGSDLEKAYKIYDQAFSTLSEQPETSLLLLDIEKGLIDLALKFRVAADAKLTSGINKIANKLVFASDLADAIAFYSNALSIYQKNCPHLQKTNEPMIVGELTKIHSSLAIAYFQQGNIAKALDHAANASTIALQYGVIDTGLLELANHFKLAANKKFGAQQFEEARQYYDSAIVVYEKYCSHLQESHGALIVSELTKISSNTAKAYMKQGMIDEAIRSAEKGMVLAQQHDVQEMLAPDKLPLLLIEAYSAALTKCDKNDWAQRIPLLNRLIEVAPMRGVDPQSFVAEKEHLEQMKQHQEMIREQMTVLLSQGQQSPGDDTGDVVDNSLK